MWPLCHHPTSLSKCMNCGRPRLFVMSSYCRSAPLARGHETTLVPKSQPHTNVGLKRRLLYSEQRGGGGGDESLGEWKHGGIIHSLPLYRAFEGGGGRQVPTVQLLTPAAPFLIFMYLTCIFSLSRVWHNFWSLWKNWDRFSWGYTQTDSSALSVAAFLFLEDFNTLTRLSKVLWKWMFSLW